ncbi:uncharacterized protein TNCV_1411401 [Trichonephila clavipes]|nr:uncharacterized protein TNCV_1411401 [Trichonephila clavipes]
MVSDGTEFAVGDIERLFEEARRNTDTKHEKWKKYYDRRRHDVQIKVNDWVLVATHPLSSATRKVVAKFKPKFEGTGSSDNGNLPDESSGFDNVHSRSNESRDGKKKRPEVKRELEEKVDFISVLPRLRKKNRREKTLTPTTSGYNLRPRKGKREDSRLTIDRKTQQGGPVRSRKGRERNHSPYIEERTRSSNKNARRGGDQQRQDQERRETWTKNPCHWRSW